MRSEGQRDWPTRCTRRVMMSHSHSFSAQCSKRVAHSFAACFTLVLSCCSSAPHNVPTGSVSGTKTVVGQSWNLCTWLGPSKNRKGIFGTDLGYEAPLPAGNDHASDELMLLFGDTYAQPTQDCQYPRLKQDDLAARIPRRRPQSLMPGAPAGKSGQNAACDSLRYSFEDPNEPTGWRPIRVFPDAKNDEPERALDTGLNRTPITAWGDGAHSFAIFYAGGVPRCGSNADCPQATTCSKDGAYAFPRIGGCMPHISFTSDAPPALCLNDDDCSGIGVCNDLDEGVCIADEPFVVHRDGQALSPDWYKRDPRDGLARQMLVASAFWPERPENYAVGARYLSTKFINVTGRTVKHFDPDNPKDNDYSPGFETLLLWGRQSFTGHDGYQTLPFLLYQPLADFIDDQGNIHWAPRYFAGYGPDGKPSWTDHEADARPIYGIDDNLAQTQQGQWKWQWDHPEFDYVNQMSVSYQQPLGRWIMIYGGESPHELDPGKQGLPKRTHPQSVPGAVYLRSSVHPWGRATASDPKRDGYGAPRPMLTTAMVSEHLACGGDKPALGECNPDLPQHRSDLLDALGSAVTDFSFSDVLDAAAKCSVGAEALDTVYSGYDKSGHLYGAAIIQGWSHEVSDALPDLQSGDRAVELYWNVSTWNPYQALLMKTQLRASEFGR